MAYEVFNSEGIRERFAEGLKTSMDRSAIVELRLFLLLFGRRKQGTYSPGHRSASLLFPARKLCLEGVQT